MTIKRKLVQICLLCAVVLLLPATVQAQFTYTNADGSIYDYSTNADGVSLTITGYSGPPWAVTIPTNFNGLTVTEIGTNAFYDLTNLTSVFIPSSVASIGNSAFMFCSNLVTVAIAPSVTNIGLNAFLGCTNLADVCFEGNPPVADSTAFFSDTHAVVYYLFGAAGWSSNFAGLPALQTTSPSQLIYQTNGATITITSHLTPLPAVIIPPVINGMFVTSISNSAFANSSLTSATILCAVTNIGPDAFLGCSSLTNVTISANVANIDTNAFEICGKLENMTIPTSVTNIGPYAFYGCVQMTNVTIPTSVTGIGDDAFEGCNDLTSVTIPACVTNFQGVFFQCVKLTNVTIANGVTSVAASEFSSSVRLTSITISASVTNIAANAFLGATSLTNFTTDGQNPFYSSLNGVLFDKSQTTLIAYPSGDLGSYVVPDSVTNLGSNAFSGITHLTGIYFTGNAPTIASSAIFNGNATVYYLPGTIGWSVLSTDTGVSVVLWNPLIQASGASFGLSNNQFGFNITGTNDFSVVVEACTNLANPVWVPLQTLTLNNGSIYFSDPQWTNYPERFYGLGFP